MFRHSLAIALLFILASVGTLSAQVPQLISYQGRIVANQVNFDGTGQFKFALVNTEGSTSYWSNDGSSAEGSEPETAVALPVSKGLYSVLLGDATKPNMTILPATVFTHGDVHLRVWFNDGVHGFQQLSPDRRIAAVGYAMMAETVADGSITSAKLADGAVTSEKLAPNVVQSANLAPGAVGNTQLANPSITINAGDGLSGGGEVALGGNITLSNVGVLSLTGGNGITVNASSGAVTLGSSATSENTPNSIVTRDANGNFSAGTITASSFVGQGLVPWTVVSGTTQQAEPNMGYIASNASEVTITLPTAPAVGDVIRVSGAGAGGWKIAQNAGQAIIADRIVLPGSSWAERESERNWSSIASSSDGRYLVASVYGGKIYTSSDFGVSWVARESDRNWSCIASSSDGSKLIAAVSLGKVYRSSDHGSSWSVIFSIDEGWNDIACSANGSSILVSSYNRTYPLRSLDSGASWGMPNSGLSNNSRNWSSVAMSSDGQTMISIADGSIYISYNQGNLWFTSYSPLNGSQSSIACSADGKTILTPRLISYDNGRNWKSTSLSTNKVTCSSDGKRMAGVTSYGLIRVSSAQTTTGAQGTLKGPARSAVELLFIGSGNFIPINEVGDIETF